MPQAEFWLMIVMSPWLSCPTPVRFGVTLRVGVIRVSGSDCEYKAAFHNSKKVAEEMHDRNRMRAVIGIRSLYRIIGREYTQFLCPLTGQLQVQPEFSRLERY